ncbi:MAG: hypothetical protein IJP43_09960 [Oscillospiraceae bacterium]|nr:hypothetical protein [Oscillospiraceae bacterium]
MPKAGMAVAGNAAASDVTLTDTEFAEIDKALSSIPMSDVYGGSRMTK